MSVGRGKSLGDAAPFRLCFPQRGRKARTERRAGATGREAQGRPVCALEMEMTNYSLQADSKLDAGSFDGLNRRNGGDSAEVSVPLAQRAALMDGDNLYRLRDRKFLLEDKKRLCALALGTAVLGIVLMIIHAETCPFIYKPVSVRNDPRRVRRTLSWLERFPQRRVDSSAT